MTQPVWSHLWKKSVMENSIYCAINVTCFAPLNQTHLYSSIFISYVRPKSDPGAYSRPWQTSVIELFAKVVAGLKIVKSH